MIRWEVGIEAWKIGHDILYTLRTKVGRKERKALETV